MWDGEQVWALFKHTGRYDRRMDALFALTSGEVSNWLGKSVYAYRAIKDGSRWLVRSFICDILSAVSLHIFAHGDAADRPIRPETVETTAALLSAACVQCASLNVFKLWEGGKTSDFLVVEL